MRRHLPYLGLPFAPSMSSRFLAETFTRPDRSTPVAHTTLPLKRFPTIKDTADHGLLPMPPGPELPLMDPRRLLPHCMHQAAADAVAFVPWTELSLEQIHDAVVVLGAGFAKYEPMLRHMVPQTMPDALRSAPYTDALGTHHWEELRPEGSEWHLPHFVDRDRAGAAEPHISRPDAIAWFVRLCFITDGSSGGALRQETLERSTAALCKKTGAVLGAVLAAAAEKPELTVREGTQPNEAEKDSSTVVSKEAANPFSATHPCLYHREMSVAVGPVIDMVNKMEQETIPVMCEAYPDLSRAFDAGEVSSFFMITKSPFHAAESPQLPVDLAKANFDQQVKLGAKYVVSEATNPWTAAMFDTAGATAGLFQPHRGVEGIVKSAVPLPGTATSTNGFISDRDAGAVFYAGRLPECV